MNEEELSTLENNMPPEEETPNVIDWGTVEAKKNHDDLLAKLQKTSKGNIKATPYNLSQILHHDDTLRIVFI